MFISSYLLCLTIFRFYLILKLKINRLEANDSFVYKINIFSMYVIEKKRITCRYQVQSLNNYVHRFINAQNTFLVLFYHVIINMTVHGMITTLFKLTYLKPTNILYTTILYNICTVNYLVLFNCTALCGEIIYYSRDFSYLY